MTEPWPSLHPEAEVFTPGLAISGSRAHGALRRHMMWAFVRGALVLLIPLSLVFLVVVASGALSSGHPQGVELSDQLVPDPTAEAEEDTTQDNSWVPVTLGITILITLPFAAIAPVRARRTRKQFDGDLLVIDGHLKGRFPDPPSVTAIPWLVAIFEIVTGVIVLLVERHRHDGDASLPRIEVTTPRLATLYVRSRRLPSMVDTPILIPLGTDVRRVRAIYAAGPDLIIPVTH